MSLFHSLYRGVWIFGCFAGPLSGVARAQQANAATIELNETARSHAEQAFWKGKEFYDAGQFEQAREQFETAYGLVKDPNLLYNIAQADRKLGNCRQALEFYEQFLKDAADSSLAAQAEKQAAELKGSCPPATPAASPSEPTAVAPRASVPAAIPVPVSSSFGQYTASNDAQSSELKTQHHSQFWVITTLVTGLAAGGTALGLGIWNQGRYDQWSERNHDLRQGLAPGETPSQWRVRQQNNNELIVSVQSADRTVVAFGIGAGALLATSGILYYFSRESESRAPSVEQRRYSLGLPLVSIGPAGAAIAWQGTFL